MTAPNIKVAIVADDKLTPAVKRIAAGAADGLSPVQRFSKALAMSEGREGGLALRSLRTGVTELALAAGGATGPLGKLAEALAMFGLGGPEFLVVTGGIAAITLAYKALGDETRELTQAHEDLKTAVLAAVHATPASTALNQEAASRGQRDAIASELAETQQRFINTGGVDPEMRHDIVTLGSRLAAANEDVAREAGAFGQSHAALDPLAMRRREERLHFREQFIAAGRNRPTQFPTTMDPALHAALSQVPFANSNGVRLGLLENQQLVDRLFGGEAGKVFGGDISRENDQAIEDSKRAWAGKQFDWRAVTGASLGFAGTVARGRSTGQDIGALLRSGGEVASAFGPEGKAVGAGLEGLGGLVNLFTSGQHKVTISNLDDQALEKIKQVVTLSGATSLVILNGRGGLCTGPRRRARRHARRSLFARLSDACGCDRLPTGLVAGRARDAPRGHTSGVLGPGLGAARAR